MSSDLTLTGLQGDFIARKLMLMEARLALTEARIKELEDNRCRCGERANATFSRPIDITASGVFLREIVAEAPAEPTNTASFSRPIEITASGVFLREIVAETPAEPTNEASFSRPIVITASGKSLRPLAITASGKFARMAEAK